MKKGTAASHVYQLKVQLCDIDVLFDEANGILKLRWVSVILPSEEGAAHVPLAPRPSPR